MSITDSPRRGGYHRPDDGLGLDWAFLDASTGLASGLGFAPSLSYRHLRRALTPAELGVFSSHVRAWRTLLADPAASQIIVLEDDVHVDWPFLARVADHDWAASGVDFLKLFGRWPAHFHLLRWNFPFRDRHLVQYTSPCLGTQAYLVTRRAAARFEALFRTASRPIDVAMERPWVTGIPVLGLVPHGVLELSIPSSIPNREANYAPTRTELARYFAGRVVEHARRRLHRHAGRRPRLPPDRRD